MEVYFAIALYLMAGCGFCSIPMVEVLFGPKVPWWLIIVLWPVFALIYLKKWCDLKSDEDD